MKESVKTLLAGIVVVTFLCACAVPNDGVRRNPTRDCPPGEVLICESRPGQEPSRGGDEEIPEYDFCYCETTF